MEQGIIIVKEMGRVRDERKGRTAWAAQGFSRVALIRSKMKEIDEERCGGLHLFNLRLLDQTRGHTVGKSTVGMYLS